ncbi:MAG: hypothetical protein FWD60_07275 [Candidatus Azobacteroides sp.]|nr:hypothetical protein [Candidatus Azobacteroides sp.]
MRKIIIFLLFAFPLVALSQNSLDNWAKTKENAPSSKDGDVQLYPLSEADGKLVVSDFIDFTGLTSEQIFVNALLYAIDTGAQQKENIESIDFAAKRFVVKQRINSAQEVDVAYKCSTRFQVADNNLSFLSSDIVYEAKNIFKELKDTPFEKIDMKKKPNQKIYIDEFTAGNSLFLSGMFKFIQTNQYEPVTHWEDISNEKVVKGMTQTECKLAAGKPVHIRIMGNKVRWMFNNDFIVLFEDGKVSSILK